MSVERDFDNSVATFIQTLVVFLLAAALIAIARRSSADYAVSFDPTLERS
jgi:hypothetical protein